MREHPIPQDVTGYKFHIVGNMTLKQFLEVAGGVVITIILFKTGLPNIIKWPFMLLSLAIGSLSAFVPVAGRPFDQWVMTFFRVIYKPTLYYWKRKAHIPDVFRYKPKNPNQKLENEPIDLTPQRHQRVHEYLASIKQTNQVTPPPDENQQREAQILNYFSEGNQRQQAKKQEKSVPPKSKLPSKTLINTETTRSDQPGAVKQVDKSVPTQTETENQTRPAIAPTTTPVVKNTPSQTATQVVFNQNLPFPSTPIQPNKIVGMVLTQNRDLVPNAIIEVKDPHGVIERAVKTNALGQFFITTPLKDGTYILWVSKENLSFQPVSLVLNNKIVPPLEIIAS